MIFKERRYYGNQNMERNMATVERIRKLRGLCVRYDLEEKSILNSCTDTELAEIYNGTGPDSWLPLARDIVTVLMELFEPAALIHDMQFHGSDGSHESFEKTAEVWKRNCRKIFDAEYPFLCWKQWFRSYRAKRIYWYGIMQAGNLAVSGDAAFQAWTASYRNNRRAHEASV